MEGPLPWRRERSGEGDCWVSGEAIPGRQDQEADRRTGRRGKMTWLRSPFLSVLGKGKASVRVF